MYPGLQSDMCIIKTDTSGTVFFQFVYIWENTTVISTVGKCKDVALRDAAAVWHIAPYNKPVIMSDAYDFNT